jgi:hypothetical protein
MTPPPRMNNAAEESHYLAALIEEKDRIIDRQSRRIADLEEEIEALEQELEASKEDA